MPSEVNTNIHWYTYIWISMYHNDMYHMLLIWFFTQKYDLILLFILLSYLYLKICFFFSRISAFWLRLLNFLKKKSIVFWIEMTQFKIFLFIFRKCTTYMYFFVVVYIEYVSRMYTKIHTYICIIKLQNSIFFP